MLAIGRRMLLDDVGCRMMLDELAGAIPTTYDHNDLRKKAQITFVVSTFRSSFLALLLS
jgi:hypothetical protein